MAIILSLETSSDVCSVAVHDNEKLLATCEVHKEQAHASKLAPLIEQVVAMADLKMNKVNAIAVSAGPGSYTGLRIGASTAKGLCFALGVPLISAGTLDIMVAGIVPYNLRQSLLCPMIDARRMEVYCSLFDANGRRLDPVEAKVIDARSFEDQLDKGPVLFFGNGADKCRMVIRHPAASFIPGVYPGAGDLGTIASRKFAANETEDLFAFEPFYLKEFRAKLPSVLIPPVQNKSVL